MTSLLGSRSLTRRRYVETIGSDGYPSRTHTDAAITGSVQVPTPYELQTLPEGQRSSQPVLVYTAADVRTVSQYDGTPADVLIIDGVSYRVQSVGEWHPLIGHRRIVATRVQEIGP